MQQDGSQGVCKRSDGMHEILLRRVGEQSSQSPKVPGENPTWDCSFTYSVHRVDTMLAAS